jgi:ribose-phosphate pyrophosphokinase
MLLFALDATRDFGARVASALGEPLARHEERTFEDAEHKIRPLVDPVGQDCVVVQSLHGEPGTSGDD